MFYAYVIRSLSDGSFYKGHCENIEKRIVQHNSGMTSSISHKLPFELICFEVFETRELAILREKYFKTAAGRKYLKQKLNLY